MPNKCSLCKQPGHNARTCTNPPVVKIPRRSGGQPGNANALKHGFYTSRFKDHDLKAPSLISDQLDISSEINLLRIVMDRALAFYHIDNGFKDSLALFNLLVRASGCLGHLLKIQKRFDSDSKDVKKMLKQFLLYMEKEGFFVVYRGEERFRGRNRTLTNNFANLSHSFLQKKEPVPIFHPPIISRTSEAGQALAL